MKRSEKRQNSTQLLITSQVGSNRPPAPADSRRLQASCQGDQAAKTQTDRRPTEEGGTGGRE
jgi:hypothetical protein